MNPIPESPIIVSLLIEPLKSIQSIIISNQIRNGTVTLALLLLLFLIIVFQFYLKAYFFRTGRLVNKFPGAFVLPFLGNSLEIVGASWKTQERITQYGIKYGKTSRFWHFSHPQVLTKDPNVCEKILGCPDLFEKGKTYELLKDLLSAGLVTSSGEKWQKDRKALNYAFNWQMYDGFLRIFNKESRMLTKKLAEDFPPGEIKDPKSLYPRFIAAAMEMIFQAALGIELNMQENEGHKYADAMHLLALANHNRIFKPYIYKVPFLSKILGWEKLEKAGFQLFIDKCRIAKQRKLKEMGERTNNNSAEDENKKTKPFLDILMEQTPPPSDKEYAEHMGTIIGAGAETSASSIHQALFFLALYPEHQKKCHEEVDAILCGDYDKELTLKDIGEAKYLEMCWKEGMRIRPPVPILSRNLTRDVHLDNGRILPQGADVAIAIYDIHNDPEIYPNPEIYDPTRFLPEKCKGRHPYSYLPFSLGNRNCIGHKYARMEAMVTLVHVLGRFQVGTRQKQKDIKIIYGVPGEPYPDIELILWERKKDL